MALCCVLMAVLVFSKWSPSTGFTALLGFGSKWDGRRTVMLSDVPIAVKRGSGGYDAQFYSQVALDPTLMDADYDNAERFIDWPSYRARRIGMSAFAYVVGAGRPEWVLNVFALINVVCWALFSWLIWAELKFAGWFGFTRWFFCCFGIGAMESVRLAQTDLPSALLILLPILRPCVFGPFARGSAMAAALFVKETALMGFVALPWLNNRRASFWTLIVAGSVYFLWLIHVYTRLGGSAGDTGNFGAPFSGLVDYLRHALPAMKEGFGDGRYWIGVPSIIGLLVQAVWLVWRWDWRSPMWRFATVYVIMVPIVGFAVWGGIGMQVECFSPLRSDSI